MTSAAEQRARAAYRSWQAVWVLVSAQHEDALARDVAAIGERLRLCIDDERWVAAEAVIAECKAWLSTMAGVVASRMQQVFE